MTVQLSFSYIFNIFKGYTKLRRDFIRHFEITNKHNVPRLTAFKRVLMKFDEKGEIQDLRSNNHRPSLGDGDVQRVEQHFIKHPRASIRQASSNLNISQSSVHKTLKQKIKFKPYRSTHVQVLPDITRERRMAACQRFLQQDQDWQRKVIWSDEKWFYLKPHPNRKNEVFWAPHNPLNLEEVRVQGATKIMVWAGFVNGRFLPLHWFEGSVTSDTYLNMLREKVWPAVRNLASRNGYWFQQDGAPPHTTAQCLKFLSEKFSGRVISNKTDFPWPPSSPDLNPLDFWFWGMAEKKVLEKKPKTVEELKMVVETFTREVSSDTLLRVSDNFMKRAAFCVQEKEGHFEHILKLTK